MPDVVVAGCNDLPLRAITWLNTTRDARSHPFCPPQPTE